MNHDLAKFEEARRLAEVDYRDLIVTAEYKDFDTRLRNFDYPFRVEQTDVED